MLETELTQRIAIVESTRTIAALLLADTLRDGVEGASERVICDRWTQAISCTGSLYPEGWYQPPPKGASILIGDPKDNFARMKYSSLREPAVWPRDDIKLRDESLIYAYSSPIDRSSCLIGDIGLTLYRGTNRSIQDHLTRCLEVTTRIASFAEVGMELRELFNYAQSQITEENMSNQASSFKSRIPNIGHTVPWSYEDYSDEAKKCLELGNLQEVRDSITKSRVFINDIAAIRIQPTMALTVEPQIGSDTMPVCSYHVIVTFVQGKRRISPAFDPIFKAFAMEGYMGATVAQLANS